MGWGIALLIYALPVLSGLRHIDDEVEDTKDWMRNAGEWYPSLAPAVAVLAIIFWPVGCIISIIEKPE